MKKHISYIFLFSIFTCLPSHSTSQFDGVKWIESYHINDWVDNWLISVYEPKVIEAIKENKILLGGFDLDDIADTNDYEIVLKWLKGNPECKNDNCPLDILKYDKEKNKYTIILHIFANSSAIINKAPGYRDKMQNLFIGENRYVWNESLYQYKIDQRFKKEKELALKNQKIQELENKEIELKNQIIQKKIEVELEIKNKKIEELEISLNSLPFWSIYEKSLVYQELYNLAPENSLYKYNVELVSPDQIKNMFIFFGIIFAVLFTITIVELKKIRSPEYKKIKEEEFRKREEARIIYKKTHEKNIAEQREKLEAQKKIEEQEQRDEAIRIFEHKKIRKEIWDRNWGKCELCGKRTQSTDDGNFVAITNEGCVFYGKHYIKEELLLCDGCFKECENRGVVYENSELFRRKGIDFRDKSHPRHISPETRQKVYYRDGGKCQICGSKQGLQFDHIIPFSKGGNNNDDNIQLLCEECNKLKSYKIGNFHNETTEYSCLESGCNGKLVKRGSKNNKWFYGCSNFPECTFVIFDEIVDLPCPNCGADYLTTKDPNYQGTLVYSCATPSCNFKITPDEYYA